MPPYSPILDEAPLGESCDALFSKCIKGTHCRKLPQLWSSGREFSGSLSPDYFENASSPKIFLVINENSSTNGSVK
jgi:hypothetical protein